MKSKRDLTFMNKNEGKEFSYFKRNKTKRASKNVHSYQIQDLKVHLEIKIAQEMLSNSYKTNKKKRWKEFKRLTSNKN
jgi:hypothetical protein